MKVLILSILLLSGCSLFSQNYKLVFEYDNAGNRYSRTMIEMIIDDKSQVENTTTDSLDFSMNEMQVTVFPNPTKGVLRIEIDNLPENARGSVLVTDLQGRVLINSEEVSGSFEVDFTPFSAGTYNMTLTIDGSKKYFGIIRE